MPGVRISTNQPTLITDRLAVPAASRLARLYRRLPLLKRKAARRRSVRVALLLSNVAILAIIVAIVLQTPHNSTDSTKTASLSSSITPVETNPLDQLSSADIAQTVAQLNGLPETTAINNQVQSQEADVAIAASNDNVVSKPQVVATALKSRADIQDYVTKPGDTISGLAAKFGVTSNSISWSNNLSGNAIAPGTKLVIPPVNGIVYTVRSGDTPASLAARFGANKSQIIAFNDAELSGLQPGEQIIIPSGTPPASVTSLNVFPWGGGPAYGYNGYDFGYCTWYVASQISVPANWGNASTWAYYASLSGWNVSGAPSVGSIAQTAYAAAGQGHVAIVTAVNSNGTITVREMNDAGAPGGGWDRVDTITESASDYQHFITR